MKNTKILWTMACCVKAPQTILSVCGLSYVHSIWRLQIMIPVTRTLYNKHVTWNNILNKL